MINLIKVSSSWINIDHHKTWCSGPSVGINGLNPLKHKFQKFFLLKLKEKQIVLKLKSINPSITNVSYQIKTRANQLTGFYMMGNIGCQWVKQKVVYSDAYPAAIYLLKVSNRNTRTRCEICSTFLLKTPEQRHWYW